MQINEIKNEVQNYIAELNSRFGENIDPVSISHVLDAGDEEEIMRLRQELKDRLNELAR